MKAIIAGGGTGGHLFPAIALAEELRSRRTDLPLLFVGVEGGVEASLLAARGWESKESGLQAYRASAYVRGFGASHWFLQGSSDPSQSCDGSVPMLLSGSAATPRLPWCCRECLQRSPR